MRTVVAGRSLLVALALLTGSTPTASAQRYWSAARGRGDLRVEALKPLFKGVDGSFLVGALFLDGVVRATEGLDVEAELPLARASVPGGIEASSLRIGNPYLGLRFRSAGKTVGGRFGVRLPLSSAGSSFGSQALQVGTLADFDRLEAFLPKVFSVRGAVEVTQRSTNGFIAGLAAGPTFLISTEGGDPEVFGDYGGRIGYETSKAYVSAELTGRLVVSESGNLAERTAHQVGAAVELRPGRVRPHLRLRLPLDKNYRDQVGLIVGAGISVVF